MRASSLRGSAPLSLALPPEGERGQNVGFSFVPATDPFCARCPCRPYTRSAMWPNWASRSFCFAGGRAEKRFAAGAVARKGLFARGASRLALQMLPLIRRQDARLMINADIELCREIGADGVQLTGAQGAELSVRPDVGWCAASCHNAAELRRAEQLGCDFALLSPVLATKSHPGAPHLGWENFAAIAAGSSIPVYALGGLTPRHADCMAARRARDRATASGLVRRFGESCFLFVRLGDAIFLVRPLAEVDQLAALAAERPKRLSVSHWCSLPQCGQVTTGCFCRMAGREAQKVSSNGTSCSNSAVLAA